MIGIKILTFGWVHPVGGQNRNSSDLARILPVISTDHPLSIDIEILTFGWVHPVGGQNFNYSDWAQILPVD